MDDEVFQLGASSQKQTLSISSSFVQRARPTFWLDLNAANQVGSSAPYVTQLVSIPSSSIVSYTDDGIFRTHDRASLSVIGIFQWEQGGICSAIKPVQNGFISAGKSGMIGYWDARQPTPTISLQGPSNAPYLSLASSTVDTNTIAAGTELQGTDARIDLWDIRKPDVPVLSYLETHSDDITSLDFHPTLHNILLSAASDALIAISDTRQQNEDDSVVGVINAGASVARAGWGGSSKVYPKASPVDDDEEISSSASNLPPLGAFYGVSDMQTVGIWEADGFSELLPVRDVRQTQMETNIPTHRHWQTEYAIDANYDSSLLENSESVGLFCGEQNGGMALMEIPHDNNNSQSSSSPNWSLHCLTSGGHADIVRSVTWDPASYILYSGGEDGRLCAWSLSGDQSSAQSNAAAAIATSLDASNNESNTDSTSDEFGGPGPKRKPLKGSTHSSSPLHSGRTASSKSYRPY
ncbi:WD40 repeat-like protein [Meira miltonrushii]|uniref:WD40 repeat-like protein n=1 Tax=Meira miltonrushii TaxID=1280837 RepID=A0A316V4T7_9BASI|nr:WD40 repeat-like protein [Meira miltonrushii]PWN31243.1 WD40 repeat-like protein [Meira miltonrushii]